MSRGILPKAYEQAFARKIVPAVILRVVRRTLRNLNWFEAPLLHKRHLPNEGGSNCTTLASAGAAEVAFEKAKAILASAR
jgi:hypothetical protein